MFVGSCCSVSVTASLAWKEKHRVDFYKSPYHILLISLIVTIVEGHSTKKRKESKKIRDLLS